MCSNSRPCSLRKITFRDGLFVATGRKGVITSTDGKNWTLRMPTFPGWDLAYGNGIFDGAESWHAGRTQAITWTYTGDPGANVKIFLIKGGVKAATISSGTSIGSGGAGSFLWNIPSTQAAGSDYRIKIVSTTNSLYKDMSNKPFTISP
jgi:hypothetical protein